MSSINCVCGYCINLNFEKTDIEYNIVPESWVDQICLLLENNKLDTVEFIDSFMLIQQTLYKCPNCSRLWLQNPKGSFDSYIPEYKTKT